MSRTIQRLLIIPALILLVGHLIGAGATFALSNIAPPPTPTGSGDVGLDLGKVLIQQSPAVAALLFIVVTFLRHIAKTEERTDVRTQRMADGFSATIKSIADSSDARAKECHEVEREISKAIAENTAVTRELATSIRNQLTRGNSS